MIYIRNLFFSYDHLSPYILENLNINIPRGSYVSIIGENGSAKTTLLKLVLGLLKPCKGDIITNSKNIGYVPQRMETFNSQFPITVLEILSCHMKTLKIKDKSCIKNSLVLTGVFELKDRLIGTLSGGQQQRVFISRALLGNPEILVLDEPSTGVDAKSQNEIYSILKNLNREKNITIVSVEHNLKAALENSSHILTLNKGSGSLYTIEEYTKAKENQHATL